MERYSFLWRMATLTNESSFSRGGAAAQRFRLLCVFVAPLREN